MFWAVFSEWVTCRIISQVAALKGTGRMKTASAVKRELEQAGVDRYTSLVAKCRELLESWEECPFCGGSGYTDDLGRDACDCCGGYGVSLGGDYREAVIDIKRMIKEC